MTSPGEMTFAEIAAHGLAIAAATTEAAFILAFADYVRDVVERETDPYTKIALFVHSMLEGHSAILLARCHGGGTA